VPENALNRQIIHSERVQVRCEPTAKSVKSVPLWTGLVTGVIVIGAPMLDLLQPACANVERWQDLIV
jgi:hypothetical protein